ncbi:MAG: hypothetical protein WBM48_19875, partial [Polyangiales bacterium]
MTRGQAKAVFGTLLALSAALGLVGVFVLTDVGQLLRISKEVVVGYFQNHVLLMFLSVAFFVAAIYVNRRFSLVRAWVL